MKETVPDTVGRTLSEARRAVQAVGWRIGEVIETESPSSRLVCSGPLRVISQRGAGPESVMLVVARQITVDV